ncbi:MAG: transcriptional regulator [Desulfobacterales bacterium]|nr:MAG: transcriptional regulator [Desulfobacterales bacterium]
MSEKKNRSSARDKAKQIIRQHVGIIKTSEALHAGIHPRTLYQLRDTGDLEQISRGIYRLTEIEPVSNPDFVVVATRIPNSVICLISALSFHEITTQIPHEISVAIPKDSKPSTMEYPPAQFYKFSQESFVAGIEEHQIDGVTVKIYSPEKTLADCFKFRNKIGMDVVLEALKLYRAGKKFDHRKILEYARICRVDKIVRPYLEASI